MLEQTPISLEREYDLIDSPNKIAFATDRVPATQYEVAGNNTAHFHTADRARANHTGTQVMATISDLPVLASGNYTATLTGVTNIDSVTSFEGQYIRVGSIVTVSGKGTIDPTAAAASEVGIALPIASNIGAVEDCCGVAAWTGIAQETAGIRGDATNNRAAMVWIATDTTAQEVTFTFTYQLI